MASTRSQTKEDTAPTCHILNYFYDNDNGFALTALVHTLRFHVMVDFARLESPQVQEEYKGLLDAVERKEEHQEKGTVTASKKRKRDQDDNDDPADSGYGSSPFVQSPSKGSTESSVALADDDREDSDAVRTLQNWILENFRDVFAERAPASEERKPKTVHDWFHGPRYFYTLTCSSDGTLNPIEEEPTKPLEKRIADLIPGLTLPKYISSHSVPIFTTADLHIDGTSDTPSPLHPAIVKSTSKGSTHFLKLVDPAQPGPVKRELKMMKDMEAAGLHNKIRMPLIEGVVVDSADPPSQDKTSGSHRPTILGFLLTHIHSATPLTTTLDADVAEGKREKWAKEVERTVKTLHDHGFVWGDAKADNFMVDDKANLWIIDFGGSYTEGWVDEELNETMEGDDQGTEKIANAVRDPEEFTFDPEEEGKSGEEQGEAKRRKVEGKSEEDEVRELQHRDEEEAVDEGKGKGKQTVQGGGSDQETYCYCDKPSSGTMVGCDGEDCEREWFHAECIDGVPEDNDTWYCDDCKAE